MKHCNKTFVLQNTLFVVCLENTGAGKLRALSIFLVSAGNISEQEILHYHHGLHHPAHKDMVTLTLGGGKEG